MTGDETPRRDVGMIAAYPKSGVTHLNFMLFHALFGQPEERAQIDRAYIVDVHEYPEQAAAPGDGMRFVKCHLPFGPALPLRARLQRAVLLVRDPIDLMMSTWDYKHLAGEIALDRLSAPAYAELFRGFVNRWIATGGLGYPWCGSWIDHLKAWLGQAEIPLLVVRYEALLQRPVEELARCLAFFNRPASIAALDAAVAFSSVDNMRSYEAGELAQGVEGAFFRHVNKDGYDRGYRFIGRLHQGAYQSVLDDAQRARVDARFGPTLAQLAQRAGA